MDRGQSRRADESLDRVPIAGPAIELSRIKSVRAGNEPWTLAVVWADGTRDRVELTGLVHRSRHFRRFLEDARDSRKVKPVDYGAGIGRENGLDYSAENLRILAEEQRPLSGSDLRKFELANALHTAETAGLFDVSERTVREYRGARRLPQPVALALRAMMASSTVLDAHFRPAARRPRGRPKTRQAG